MYFKIKGTYFKIYGLYFFILKDLINSNLHKLAETPLSHCFSACCGKNSLIALSDSLFCAK